MPHAQASGFPAPCFDREGQALALRLRKELFYTVVRGPSHATRAGERVSLAVLPVLQKKVKNMLHAKLNSRGVRFARFSLFLCLIVFGALMVSLGAVARRGQIPSRPASEPSQTVPPRAGVAESLVAAENMDSLPYQVGEKLTYGVKVRGLPAGKRTDHVVQKTAVNGQSVYHIRSDARTKSIFRLYHFRNQQETYIGRGRDVSESLLQGALSDAGLSPVRFRNRVEDRKYRATVIANFLPASEAERTQGAGEIAYEKISRRNPKSPQRHAKKTLTMPDGTQDELSMLYFLRSKCLTLGKTYFFPLLAEGKVQKVRLTVERRDIVKNKALGRVRTLVLRASNGSRLWLTDDARRIPVRIEAESKIGTMKAELEKIETVSK